MFSSFRVKQEAKVAIKDDEGEMDLSCREIVQESECNQLKALAQGDQADIGLQSMGVFGTSWN